MELAAWGKVLMVGLAAWSKVLMVGLAAWGKVLMVGLAAWSEVLMVGLAQASLGWGLHTPFLVEMEACCYCFLKAIQNTSMSFPLSYNC